MNWFWITNVSTTSCLVLVLSPLEDVFIDGPCIAAKVGASQRPFFFHPGKIFGLGDIQDTFRPCDKEPTSYRVNKSMPSENGKIFPSVHKSRFEYVQARANVDVSRPQVHLACRYEIYLCDCPFLFLPWTSDDEIQPNDFNPILVTAYRRSPFDS